MIYYPPMWLPRVLETYSCAAVAGISSAVCSIVSFSLGVIVAVLLLFGCYIPRRNDKAKRMQNTVTHQDTTMKQTIQLETNELGIWNIFSSKQLIY